eukprot:351952-Chlamydomonas_euryale.AAC.3
MLCGAEARPLPAILSPTLALCGAGDAGIERLREGGMQRWICTRAHASHVHRMGALWIPLPTFSRCLHALCVLCPTFAPSAWLPLHALCDKACADLLRARPVA